MYVMELHGKSPSIRKARGSSVFAIPDGLIGLEYEYEGTNRFDQMYNPKVFQKVNEYFECHTDGSLRDGGNEFVLREPLFGEELLQAITVMDEAARSLRFKSSYRTSMHVHLDMERATYPAQVLSVAILYAIAEPFLYKFVGTARDMCNYCLPWYRHDQHFGVFLKGLKELEGHPGPIVVDKLRRLKEFKYSGLNFFSLGDYGTLEFRQAPVGMDAVRVIEWVNIIQSLKKYAMGSNHNYETILSRAFSQPYTEFLSSVFTDHYKSLTRYTARPTEAYNMGLKTAASFAAHAAQLGL